MKIVNQLGNELVGNFENIEIGKMVIQLNRE